MENIGFIVMDIIVMIPFTGELIRILFGIRDIKDTFTCKNCGTFSKTVSKGIKCSKCHRKFDTITKDWEYLMINRKSYIDTKNSTMEYVYKDYLKPFKIELVLCSIAIVIMLTALILNIIAIL